MGDAPRPRTGLLGAGLLGTLLVVLAPGTARAQYVYFQPDGTGIPQTNRLQVIFDAQGESIDAVQDASLVPETFYPALSLTFTDLAEGAGYENIFGWYNVGDDIGIETNRHPIFYTAYDHGYVLPATCDPAAGCLDERCSDPSCSQDPYDGHNSEPFSPPWDTRTVSLCGDPRWKGGPIGFFIITPEGISGSTARNDVPDYGYLYFSEPRLNILEQGVDNPYIHHLVYQSSLDPTSFYFGFEDLYRGGDNDFEDMLVKVEGLLVDAPLEVCNAVDDDCDGLTDENVTRPCSTLCGDGVESCVGGAFDPQSCTAREPTAETCNAVDDDCDGVVDEELVRPCSNQCGSGVEFCVNGGYLGCTAPLPEGESCDNLDNDCDGQTDEDLQRDCATACGTGQEHCDHGAWVDCSAAQPGLEVCDAVDNDCDGLTDEDLELGCSTACGAGLRLCVDGDWGECSAAVPEPELCDHLDNDCDGLTDEIWADLGQACTVTQGQCSGYGVWICNAQGNGLVCDGQIHSEAERCDGADNDCDGAVDESDPQLNELCGECDAGQQPPCWSEEGVCQPGHMLCIGGLLVCSGEIRPGAEVCDALDNDCDGETDEDFRDLPEICDDGIDNDCDGQTDLFDSECSSVCEPGQQEPCGIDTGECQAGLRICGPDGNWSECVGAVGPGAEVCDSLDNDCDGLTDEDATPEVCDDGIDNDCDGAIDGLDDDCGECVPGDSRPCGQDVGQCTAGEQACNAQGHWGPCLGETTPAPESCDGLDDDCDGLTDEGDLCDGYEVCLCGRCSSACSAGECPAGDTICVQGWCLEDRCCGVACPPGQVCQPRTGACADPCLVQPPDCAPDEVCRLGQCVPVDCFAPGHGCPDGERCVAGACQADPCSAVDCPAGQYCREGACEAVVCGDCGADQECIDGQCVESACAGVACGPGQVCSQGQCAADPCQGVWCPPAQRCADGVCQEDPCLHIVCPADSACVDGWCQAGQQAPDGGLDGGDDGGADDDAGADGDGGQADAGRPDAGADAAGGTDAGRAGELAGGCDCGQGPAGGSGGWLWLVLLGGWALGRRRRAAALILALGLGGGLLAGCTCSDVVAAGDAGFGCRGDDDCQSGYRCRQGTCQPGPACLDFDSDGHCDWHDGGDDCNDNRDTIHPGADELCDGVDNDCDGLTDEDCPCRAGQSQACGIDTGICSRGVQDCEDGHWSECRGARLPDDEEDCADYLDNDCDGAVNNGCPGCTPGDGRACGSDLGQCSAGVQLCEEVAGEARWGACLGGTPPVDEVCGDGLDNDCDGAVDEGCTCQDGETRWCGSNQGTCTAGQQTCRDGVWGPCQGAVLPEDELCDGLDNDCDGLTDDGCECVDGLVRTCGSEVGQCQTGTQACSQGRWSECQGEVVATGEQCDYLDNDCDGATDEDFADLRTPCQAGLGTCARPGLWICDPDDPARTKCTATPGQPGLEVCDGLDNDCDGSTDEDFPNVGDACEVGQGECHNEGVNVCAPQGGIACNVAPIEPQQEVCDGLDNDCDGHTDENFPLVGVVCFAGLGECQVTGTHVCAPDGQGSVCDAIPPEGTAEQCNGLDDDCDGLTDEDLQTACSNDCGSGLATCVAGNWVGCTAPQPFAELCDGLDNDCDGLTDEDFSFPDSLEHCGGCGRLCAPPHGVGLCVLGNCVVDSCQAGWHDLNGNAVDGCEYACSPSGAEQCNGLDDDCDGQIDEDPGAPPGPCLDEGVCSNIAPRCLDGSWQCLYPPTYQATEDLCDDLDNDCDGQIDEGYADKNESCSAGLGVCRRNGVYVCNAAGDATECTAAPDLSQQGDELCDALDNDCDGQIDEDLDDSAEMIRVEASGLSFWIDRWEASRPDATADDRGSQSGYPCSKPGVLPWDDIDWNAAQAACQARGKRLCTDAEWRLACGGEDDWAYPYGDTFDGQACNTRATAAAPAGSLAGCASPFAVLDQSGNLAEWADCADPRDCRTVKPLFGGDWDDTLELMLTCWFRNNAGPGFHLVGLGFRCCKD